VEVIIVSNLMTTSEAAEYLDLHYMTVYKLTQQGRIPAFKIGRNWRFQKNLLDDWLANRETAAEVSVLIVDDDPEIRRTISRVVLQKGLNVVAVRSVDEALEELEQDHFKAIFLDLALPGTNCVEALSTIREKANKAVVAVIASYADAPTSLDAMSLGPMCLIRNPLQVNDITEGLNAVTKG